MLHQSVRANLKSYRKIATSPTLGCPQSVLAVKVIWTVGPLDRPGINGGNRHASKALQERRNVECRLAEGEDIARVRLVAVHSQHSSLMSTGDYNAYPDRPRSASISAMGFPGPTAVSRSNAS